MKIISEKTNSYVKNQVKKNPLNNYIIYLFRV